VLQTIFTTAEAQLRLVDYMPIRPRRRRSNLAERVTKLLPNNRQRPRANILRDIGNDVAAAHRIDRVLTCLEGHATIEVTVKATFDYARQTPEVVMHRLASGGVAAILGAGGRYLVLVLRYLPSGSADPPNHPIELDLHDAVVRARVPLATGHRLAAALNYARNEQEAQTILSTLVHRDFDADLDETLAYWHDWLALCKYDGPYQEPVWRSALALKLCTFEPSGAIIAAPTTSLPERIGGVRNWDYRYTWLRDSAFTLGALGRLGYFDEARDYFHFFHDLEVHDIHKLRIMYSIRGESGHELAEQELPHLEGYMGSGPVRIGNAAATQRQMDVYGELLDSVSSYLHQSGFRRGRRNAEPMHDLRALVELVADFVAEHWQADDEGIWEIRGHPRPFVYSRAMCWVALDRACQMAAHHGHEEHKDRWASVREEIRNEVLTRGYDQELSSFIQSYGARVLDSANFRLPLVGFIEAQEPQMASSIAVMKARLAGPQGLLYRYLPVASQPEDSTQQSSIDGLPSGEGAFLTCTYWLIGSLCRLGQVEEARERFEQLLAYASPLGLLSEEIDPTTGALLGNYPQAYTHIGLINAAVNLQRAQQGEINQLPGEPMKG
ncbi:MAG TPA: glycoside hydrolase family 15 protein, partial [Ktedonobacterales bacterium]|nr:glycoside hydrolase family 15 protein [Ktedonobacterales bacterium]